MTAIMHDGKAVADELRALPDGTKVTVIVPDSTTVTSEDGYSAEELVRIADALRHVAALEFNQKEWDEFEAILREHRENAKANAESRSSKIERLWE